MSEVYRSLIPSSLQSGDKRRTDGECHLSDYVLAGLASDPQQRRLNGAACRAACAADLEKRAGSSADWDTGHTINVAEKIRGAIAAGLELSFSEEVG
jgi:hypothetical protein